MSFTLTPDMTSLRQFSYAARPLTDLPLRAWAGDLPATGEGLRRAFTDETPLIYIIGKEPSPELRQLAADIIGCVLQVGERQIQAFSGKGWVRINPKAAQEWNATAAEVDAAIKMVLALRALQVVEVSWRQVCLD